MAVLEFPPEWRDGPALSGMRRCRGCGCRDDRACIDPETGEPCHWVAWDLCSACARGKAVTR
ncbi:MAG: hypothetical protein OXC28_07295 [Defluviicoccus sp.]|nr:hypothetical protein [Defluviicoccus sp.]